MNKNNRLFTLLWVFCAFLVVQNASALENKQAISTGNVNNTNHFGGTYHALLIGNNIYTDPQAFWPSLSTPVFDAQGVKTVLTTLYHFADVTLLINATRRQILNAFNDLNAKIQVGDSVLIYYAGHGYFDKANKLGYWVPVDAEGQDDATYISNSTIKNKIQALTAIAQNTLLIADSCYSGSLLRLRSRSIVRKQNKAGLETSRDTVQLKRFYEKIAMKKSAQLLSSGGLEFVDDNYLSSGHSPYTYFLINEMKTMEKPFFTASELALNVQQLVAANVQQTPESGVIFGVGHEGGEFVFQRVVHDRDWVKYSSKSMDNNPSNEFKTEKFPQEKKTVNSGFNFQDLPPSF